MLGRNGSRVTLASLAWLVTVLDAAAQRPPSSSEPGKGGMSIDKAIQWLLARPGVMIAIALILAALVFMYVTRSRPKT